MAFVMSSGGGGVGRSNIMAKFEEGNLWVPSGFLGEEIESKVVGQNCGSGMERQFSYEWGRRGDSNLSSPVESAVGLCETDEEDDYMACLAQRVAYSMLDDDDDENCRHNRTGKWVPHHQTKGSLMAISSQSTLTEFENWSSKMYGGGLSSQLPTSPCMNVKEDASAWVLFNMAGLNAARFEHGAFDQTNHGVSHEMPGKSYLRAAVGELGPHFPRNVQRTQSVAGSCVSRKEFQAKAAQHLGFENAYNGFHQGQIQRAWNPRPKDEEHNVPVNLVAKQCLESANSRQSKVAQAQNRGVNARLVNRPNPSYATGHMGGGSGMRAVFLGSNGPGRESGGTGVFLPRRMDNGYTAKSKPACSTVLLPARIVQALNLNVEDLRSQPCGLLEVAHNRRDNGRRFEKRQSLDGDCWPELQQKQQQSKGGFYPGCYESQHPSSEISLPQEWTY